MKKFIVGSTEIVLTETGCLLTSFLNPDEFDQTQILNMGLDATATDTKDDRGPWTRVPRQIKCNNGLELLNEISDTMDLLKTASKSNQNIDEEHKGLH